METKIIEYAVSAIGAAIFALIGFVWKISHRTTILENRLENMERTTMRNQEEIRRELQAISAGLDKNREWTTNRMLSMAKDMRE